MSLFKRFFGLADGTSAALTTPSLSPDIRPLGEFLKKKYANGVNYNMRIVIRGDRGVGKSSLLARLKGGAFVEDYVPTSEIQAASVHWNYQNTSEVIKVDVWDVVDKGQPRPSSSRSPRITDSSVPLPEPCLDANFLNVYKGAHGVILVMDMTKSWTFNYVRQELPRVPGHLPVLILANYRDMAQHRSVFAEDVHLFLFQQDSLSSNSHVKGTNGHLASTSSPSPRLIPVQYCEASMRNGFGLIYVHKFFCLPFLNLQRSILQYQLARNELALNGIINELEHPIYPVSTDSGAYEAFLRHRQARSGCLHQQSEQHPDTHGKQIKTTGEPLHLANGASPSTRVTSLPTAPVKVYPSNPMVLPIQDDIDPVESNSAAMIGRISDPPLKLPGQGDDQHGSSSSSSGDEKVAQERCLSSSSSSSGRNSPPAQLEEVTPATNPNKVIASDRGVDDEDDDVTVFHSDYLHDLGVGGKPSIVANANEKTYIESCHSATTITPEVHFSVQNTIVQTTMSKPVSADVDSVAYETLSDLFNSVEEKDALERFLSR